MKKSILDNLEKAKFTGEGNTSTKYGLDKDSKYATSNCDSGLPPGCDCICNQPCNFGIADEYKLVSKEI